MVVLGVIILSRALILAIIQRVLLIMNKSSNSNKHDVLVLILCITQVLVPALKTVLKSMVFQYEL